MTFENPLSPRKGRPYSLDGGRIKTDAQRFYDIYHARMHNQKVTSWKVRGGTIRKHARKKAPKQYNWYGMAVYAGAVLEGGVAPRDIEGCMCVQVRFPDDTRVWVAQDGTKVFALNRRHKRMPWTRTETAAHMFVIQLKLGYKPLDILPAYELASKERAAMGVIYTFTDGSKAGIHDNGTAIEMKDEAPPAPVAPEREAPRTKIVMPIPDEPDPIEF